MVHGRLRVPRKSAPWLTVFAPPWCGQRGALWEKACMDVFPKDEEAANRAIVRAEYRWGCSCLCCNLDAC